MAEQVSDTVLLDWLEKSGLDMETFIGAAEHCCVWCLYFGSGEQPTPPSVRATSLRAAIMAAMEAHGG